MGKFILGIIVALLCLAIGAIAYTHLGFANVAADEPVSHMERFMFAAALDPSVERHADHVDSPVPVNDANLIEGMKVYEMNCANCHGGMDQQISQMGRAMFPAAPQLVRRGSHDPGWFTFYQIQHGIRHSGMPSWDKLLSSDQIWKTVLFLQSVKKLPPAVQQSWNDSHGVTQPEAPKPAPQGQEAPRKK